MIDPFPGMDPWLESNWRDFHGSFITYLRDVLKPLLPDDLRVSMDVDAFVEELESSRGRRRPDLQLHVGETTAAYDSGAVAVESEPVSVPTRRVVESVSQQRFLKITDASSGGRIVTAIELLSPTNKKRGIGLAEYQKKQKEMRSGGVNFLEIDLLRAGEAATLAAQEGLEADPADPYHVSLFRATGERGIELYAIGFAETLPKVALPLREADKPIPLSLQSAMTETKFRGDWARDFDYAAEPPGVSLTAEERAWLDGRLDAAAETASDA